MASEQGMSGEWPARPWIMATLGALAGLALYFLTDELHRATPGEALTIWRQAAAAGLVVATLAFMLTAERRRLPWAGGFALGWGVVIALIGWSSASYNRNGELFEFPFLSAILAVLIAAPLFQTFRDEGRRPLPYAKVHAYAWTDAIVGGASLAFTGLTFLLAFLLSALFDAIGIDLLKELLDEGWFALMLAGAAFGAASAVLRDKAPLLGTLQKLVMMVFAVLAPVLAISLAVYLLALPATGFSGLWRSGLPETPLLLSAAAFAFVFLNAIIGDSSDDRRSARLWRVTEVILLLAILPLALLALVSMSMRVGQYGWTPERLWGVIACLVAAAFGAAGWWAFATRRGQFDDRLRESQKTLAAGLCGLALFLALPIVDFGAISAQSQLARLEAGKVTPAEFDWTAMAFDFGPSGRSALGAIRSLGGDKGKLAGEALAQTSRYETAVLSEKMKSREALPKRVVLRSRDLQWSPELIRRVEDAGGCGAFDEMRCALLRLDENRLLLVRQMLQGSISTAVIDLRAPLSVAQPAEAAPKPVSYDVTRDSLEIRPVERRQLYVDGQPVGEVFE